MSNNGGEVARSIALVCLSLAVIGCAASSRLGEYEFRDLTAAAVTGAAPQPQVLTDPDLRVDHEDPIGSFLRIGSGLVKEVEAEQARARVDSAVARLSLPDLVSAGILAGGSLYLHYRPIEDPHSSDYLFDVRIRNYGIDAKSWQGNAYYQIDIEVFLLDNITAEQIWHTRAKEREPLSRRFFGPGGAAADDVLTAAALSELTVEEIAEGLSALAEYTADRITERLRQDFSSSRRKE